MSNDVSSKCRVEDSDPEDQQLASVGAQSVALVPRFLCFLFGHDNIVWGAHFCGDGAIWTKCLRCGKRTETSV